MARDFSDLVLTEAPDTSIITTKEGIVAYWTKGADRLFSYKLDERRADLVEMLMPEPSSLL